MGAGEGGGGGAWWVIVGGCGCGLGGGGMGGMWRGRGVMGSRTRYKRQGLKDRFNEKHKDTYGQGTEPTTRPRLARA